MTTLQEEFEEAIDTLEALAHDEETQEELLAEFDGDTRNLANFCSRLYDLAGPLSEWALKVWPNVNAEKEASE